ncbi:helix-turn-helix domain-containing protein [Bosea sp. NPDC055332]
MTGPLGTIYSLQEAADYLKVSKSALARAARRHGIGARFGREIRFNEADVKDMWEAMRAHPEAGSLTNSVSKQSVEKAFENLRKQALAHRVAKAARKGRRS